MAHYPTPQHEAAQKIRQGQLDLNRAITEGVNVGLTVELITPGDQPPARITPGQIGTNSALPLVALRLYVVLP